MNRKPLFLLAFLFFGLLLAFPPFIQRFNRPELAGGFPLIMVYLVGLSFLILWIFFYFYFYRD